VGKPTQRKFRVSVEDCGHPNLQHSELSDNAERRRREEHKKVVARGERRIRRLLRRASQALLGPPAHTMAAFSEALLLFTRSQAVAAEGNFKGAEFEKKVVDEVNPTWTSIKFWCDQCGLRGEFDVVKPGDVAKECKADASLVSPGQFAKEAAILPRIFPGTAMHVAVPSGQAHTVRNKFPKGSMKGKIQEH
jgi:hypothetical protein